MKIIIKHILRNIWSKKGRSILIILALIIASSTFILNLTLPNEIIFKIEETFRKIYGNSDIEISSNIDNTSIENINFGNEDIRYTTLSRLDGTDNDGNALVLLGSDINTAKKMKLVSGDVPDLKLNEAVISKKYEEDYKEGDIISFYYNGNSYDIKIIKIVEKKGINAIEINDTPIFYANIETLNNINDNEEISNSVVYLDIKDNNKIDSYIDYLKENNKDYTIRKVLDTDSLKEQTIYITSIMTIIFVMSTSMIFFVTNSLNKIIIDERMPVIGTFRSIGATKSKMNLILILENAIYGLIGGTIGSYLGYLINSSVSTLFITVSGTELSTRTSNISLSTFLIGILFAIILEILMTISSIVKANKKEIKNIIFDVQSTRYILKKINIIIGTIFLLGAIIINNLNIKSQIIPTIIAMLLMIIGIANLIPVFIKLFSISLSKIFNLLGLRKMSIASKNIGYNKIIISSARMIVIATLLIIPILNVSKVISRTFESFKYMYEDVCDIIVYNTSKEYENYDMLLENDEIVNIDYLYHYSDDNVTYNNGKKFNYIPLFVGRDNTRMDIKELDYKIKNLKYNEILFDEKLLENNNLKVGDTIKIKFDILNKELEYKIVGTVNSANFTTARNIIVINLDNYLENIRKIPSQFELKAKDGIDLKELKKKIKAELKEPFIMIKTFDEFIGEQEESTSGIINLVYVIEGLAIFLAFIGIVNNQIIGFIQRRKELAVLNSTCMSKGQLMKMLFTETLLVNIISCLIGLVISFLLTDIIDSFLQGMSLYLEMVFDLENALKFIFIIIIVLLFTLIVPLKRLRKMNIIDEIKYE